MSTGFRPEEEALYFKTGDALLKRLRESDEANVLDVIRRALPGFQKAFESAPTAARAAVDCCAGCDTCCHERVAVQAHEVFLAVEFILTHFTPVEFEALIVRAATHRQLHAARNTPGWSSPRTPCVLLREGSCSIYEARPGICRAHHSRSVEGCRTNLAAGSEVVDVKIHGLRGRMFAVMLGIDSAVEEAGYDAEAYDFGSALHEALTNSLCAHRWARHQPAFPVDCREASDGA